MNRQSNRRNKTLGKKNRGHSAAPNPHLLQLLQAAYNHHQAGHLDAAVAGYRQVLQMDPRQPDANHFLGLIAHQSGQYEAAVQHISAAIKGNPRVAAFHYNLGLALQRLELWKQAEAAFRKAHKLEPDHAEAVSNLAQVLHKLGRLDDAVDAFQKALTLKPNHIVALNNLGLCLQDKRDLDDAIEAFRKAIELDPEFFEAHNNLGNILEELGFMDEAHASFLRAIEIKPDFVEAYRHLITSRKNTEYSDEIRAMEALLENPDLPESDKMHLNFGLAKAFEDLQDFNRSFTYVMEGNRLKRQSFEYDTALDVEVVNRLKEAFDEAFFAGRPDWGSEDSTPIFIIGMPRSGTSLVEQILASHPDVFGAGELLDLTAVCRSFDKKGKRVFPETMSVLKPKDFKRLGADYVKRLRLHSVDAFRITDKLPGNFLFAGMIKAILPNARVIHCQRDAVDTCVSIYKNYFLGEQPYAYDMAELGAYYRLYENLMEHWHKVLPGFIHDIRYEDLVSDPEPQIRGLLEACGLPFDEACLSFYKTKRPVRTVSVVQVRQPMYKDSVKLWKHYEEHLTPLLEALDGKGG